MECRNDWNDRSFRWQRTSNLEYLTGLNITFKTDSMSSIELILTQLTVDVDCGYPDIPINGNYSKSWMNTIYNCNTGVLVGDKNVSCLYNGRWAKPKILPKCCVGNECESETTFFNSVERKFNNFCFLFPVFKVKNVSIEGNDNTVVIIIIVLSSAVVVLGILVIVLIIRIKKKQNTKSIERTKSMYEIVFYLMSLFLTYLL
jgi:hypothetical protein